MTADEAGKLATSTLARLMLLEGIVAALLKEANEAAFNAARASALQFLDSPEPEMQEAAEEIAGTIFGLPLGTVGRMMRGEEDVAS